MRNFFRETLVFGTSLFGRLIVADDDAGSASATFENFTSHFRSTSRFEQSNGRHRIDRKTRQLIELDHHSDVAHTDAVLLQVIGDLFFHLGFELG